MNGEVNPTPSDDEPATQDQGAPNDGELEDEDFDDLIEEEEDQIPSGGQDPAKEKRLEALRRAQEANAARRAAGIKPAKPKTPEERLKEDPGSRPLAVKVYCREWTGYLGNLGCRDAPIEEMRREAQAMYAAARKQGLVGWIRETCRNCVSAANNTEAMRDIRNCRVMRCTLRPHRPYKLPGEKADGTPVEIPQPADGAPPFSAEFICRAVRALEEHCLANRLELPLSKRADVILGLYEQAKAGGAVDAAGVGRLLEATKP